MGGGRSGCERVPSGSPASAAFVRRARAPTPRAEAARVESVACPRCGLARAERASRRWGPEVRRAAARALGLLGEASARHAAALLALLCDGSEKVRRATAWSLSQLGPAVAEHAGDLAALLRVDDGAPADARGHAARLLGGLGDTWNLGGTACSAQPFPQRPTSALLCSSARRAPRVDVLGRSTAQKTSSSARRIQRRGTCGIWTHRTANRDEPPRPTQHHMHAQDLRVATDASGTKHTPASGSTPKSEP